MSLSDFTKNGTKGMAAIVKRNTLKRSGSNIVWASLTTEMLLAGRKKEIFSQADYLG
jgi:hypothetical protein